MFLDQFFQSFTLINHPALLLLVLTIGMVWIDRNVFSRAIILFLFSMLLGTLLKILFQIPLKPHLGEGFALPSGHMFVNLSFWGYLAYAFRKRMIWSLLILFVPLYGYALVYLNFHDTIDIIAAIGLGILNILLYIYLIKIIPDKILGFILSFTGLLLMSFYDRSYPHTWMALGGLIGVSSGKLLSSDKYLHPLKMFLVTISGILIIHISFNLFPMEIKTKKFLVFYLIGFWLSGINYFYKAKNFSTNPYDDI